MEYLIRSLKEVACIEYPDSHSPVRVNGSHRPGAKHYFLTNTNLFYKVAEPLREIAGRKDVKIIIPVKKMPLERC